MQKSNPGNPELKNLLDEFATDAGWSVFMNHYEPASEMEIEISAYDIADEATLQYEPPESGHYAMITVGSNDSPIDVSLGMDKETAKSASEFFKALANNLPEAPKDE